MSRHWRSETSPPSRNQSILRKMVSSGALTMRVRPARTTTGRRAKQLAELAHFPDGHVDDEVDVVGGARFAVDRAGQTSADEIGRANLLQRLGDPQCDVDDVFKPVAHAGRPANTRRATSAP